MMTNDVFEVRREPIDDGVILHPIGDIDLSRSPELRTEITAAQKDGPKRLVIDLGNVPYMDSSGVATLVEAMQNARRRHTRLVLCNMQPKVRAIFEIARLEMVFNIVDSIEQAKEA